MRSVYGMLRNILRRLGVWVRRFLREQRHLTKVVDPNMAGGCAICSMILWFVLRRMGLRPTFVVGYYRDDTRESPHAWLELDGEIIDATASQFGHRRAVLFTEDDDDRYSPHRRGWRAIRTVNHWGYGQSPAHHVMTIDAAVAGILG